MAVEVAEAALRRVGAAFDCFERGLRDLREEPDFLDVDGIGAAGEAERERKARIVAGLRGARYRSCNVRPLRGQRSRMAATPMPPAVQMDTSPRASPRCAMSLASVATIRVPVAANG